VDFVLDDPLSHNAILFSLHPFLISKIKLHVIVTDFKKAFELVNHYTLIKELIATVFSKTLLLWFRSFLSNRYSKVKVLGVCFDVFLAPSGVPLGGHLSSKVLSHSKLLYFVNDMKIRMQINTLEHRLQNDFDNFVEWSQSLGLTLNFDKRHTMAFSRKCFYKIKLLRFNHLMC